MSTWHRPAGTSAPSLADPHRIIVYPDSDGKPMAKNDMQYRCIVDTHFGLDMYDPAAHVWLPTPEREAETRRAAEARAAGAEERLRALEAELRRLGGEGA